jgi:hypothetical protein
MLGRQDLMTLEAYARVRDEYRRSARQHRRARQIALGDHVTLQFEDQETIRYQIQEMLHIERTFEESGIQDELDAYVPLIPTGTNFRATMMIEYSTPAIRHQRLRDLVGIETRVYVQVEGSQRVYARADEDLERATDAKTSAVHFLTFELSESDRRKLQAGAGLAMGIDHARYTAHVSDVPDALRGELVSDLV